MALSNVAALDFVLWIVGEVGDRVLILVVVVVVIVVVVELIPYFFLFFFTCSKKSGFSEIKS
jgi:hypothetical protein